MKVAWDGEHPDEGSIHAWLDGEIDADDAIRLEEHVRTCATCTAAVAEARGLVAGASRVLGMLDDAPAPLIRPAPTPAPRASKAWRFRVTPARSAIAAMLLVAVGIFVTREQGAFDSVAPSASKATSAEVATAPAVPDDHLLDSAIKRRLLAEQPPRAMQAAPGAAVSPPVASPSPGARELDEMAAQRVAVGRASLKAQADTMGAPADRARFGATVANAAPARDVAAAAAAENLSGKVASVTLLPSLANRCVRLESSAANATWGPEHLPVTLVFDATGTNARVFSAAGTATETRAQLLATTPDSTVIQLRRIGYAGRLVMAGTGDVRVGTMRSSQQTLALEEVVTTSTGAGQRRAVRADAPTPAAAAPVVAGVPLTARMVSCPTG